MTQDDKIVAEWSDKEFLERIIKEASLICVAGGGTSDERYFALKRILKASEIRLNNLNSPA